MKIETLRKRLSTLETLLKQDRFPVIIEEMKDHEKAEDTKSYPTAQKMLESLVKKLTGDNADRYEGHKEVAELIGFMLSNTENIRGLMTGNKVVVSFEEAELLKNAE